MLGTVVNVLSDAEAEENGKQTVPIAKEAKTLICTPRTPTLNLARVEGPQGFGLVRMPCSFCGGNFEMEHIRLRNKTTGTWKCTQCMFKKSTLQTHFGSWPPPSWQLLDATQQQAFFRYTKSDKADLLRQLKIKASQVDTHSKHDDRKGSFHPLGYYEKLGMTSK